MIEIILFISTFYNEVEIKKLPEKICISENISGRYTNRDSVIRWNKYEAKTVYICQSNDKQSIKSTLIHELWHYYRYNKLSEEQKQEYQELFEKSSSFFDFGREYGQKNVFEDFATMFEFLHNWWTEEFASPVLNEKILFIKKLIWQSTAQNQ